MFNLVRKNKKGFTLIELIVVIAILGILAAVAIVSFSGVANDATAKVNVANATNMATGINTFNALNPTVKTLESKGSLTYSAVATTVGADLWPQGLTAEEYAAAWALVNISNRVATVTR